MTIPTLKWKFILWDSLVQRKKILTIFYYDYSLIRNKNKSIEMTKLNPSEPFEKWKKTSGLIFFFFFFVSISFNFYLSI